MLRAIECWLCLRIQLRRTRTDSFGRILNVRMYYGYREVEGDANPASIARSFKLSFESPKTESLSLFKLGAPAYDHVILLPPKSKGM